MVAEFVLQILETAFQNETVGLVTTEECVGEVAFQFFESKLLTIEFLIEAWCLTKGSVLCFKYVVDVKYSGQN